MQIGPELIAKYVWVALMVVVIAAIVLVVVLPNTETRSVCTGFQYFVFINQKMTDNSYQIQLLNGPTDISVKELDVNGISMNAATKANAGDSFVLASTSDPTDKKGEEVFSYRVSVSYDTNGIKDNRDSATCTGRVQ